MNKKIASVVWLVLGCFVMSGFAATYYVDVTRSDDSGGGTSPTTAKKTIQAAVDLTTDGDIVSVYPGTYNLGSRVTPNGGAQMNRVCITNSITLLSMSGPSVTLIEGAAGSNGSNDVDSIRGVYLGTNATLSGFSVSGGYGIPDGKYPVYAAPGAGVWLTTGAVVSNCVIQGNSTRATGGGVYLNNGGLLTDSTILDNTSLRGGGGVHLNHGGTVERCTMENNIDIEFNGGGGAKLEGFDSVINRSIFQGNEAATGAGAHVEMGGTLNNCLLINNTASESGGGVTGSESTLNNCTLSGNHAVGTGGGFSSGMMGMSTLDNCIIWGNTAANKPNLGAEEWSGNTIRYTCIPLGEGITNFINGCITSDPLFVSVATTNYQLQAASPCVNAGNNPYAPSGTDLAGDPRINNAIIDMGAYEQTAALPTYVITTTAGANGTMSPMNPSVYQGSDQEITITPDVAYRIDEITMDGSVVPSLGTHTFTNVQSVHTLAATFVIDPHFLTINSGSAAGSYTNAQVVPISADAAGDGYEFSQWTVLPTNYVGNLASPSSATTTFTMPQENVELTATYTGIVDVQNVSVVQRPGTKLVDISYDLFCGATNVVEVSLTISNSTVAVVANTLSGDIGSSVATGSNRSILWDMGTDWNGNVADLTFTVLGVSGSFPAYSGSQVHSVDSRNYTLEVSSSVASSTQTGTVQKVSKKGFYNLSRSYGRADGDSGAPTMRLTNTDDKEARFKSYASASFPLKSWGQLPIGSKALCNGSSRIKVDPATGTLEASSHARNRGGPRYYYDDHNERKSFYTSQTWGTAESVGGTRRLFEVTGTQPFLVTLNLTYEGDLESDEGAGTYFDSISLVSLIKNKYQFSEFMNSEFSWGMASDLATDPDSYDWVFGDNQDVVEFLAQVSFSEKVENMADYQIDILEHKTCTFVVNPGDLILVGDYISLSSAVMNPLEVRPLCSAESDDCIVTSELRIEAGSGGGLSEYAYMDGESIGDPVPDVGVHSNYCWMSTVTCSVDAVEGYTNTGWTGTGSIPASGSSSNTGSITLSNLNSSIDWVWEFVGYDLTVSGGSGSGTYENGEVVSISAEPVGFSKWSGDYAEDLDDIFSPSTLLRMPDANTVLTPLYSLPEVYVDASMPDDSLDGSSWATAKKTIQTAVDWVSSDGIIWVTNGMYNAGSRVTPGGTQMNRVCITKPVTLRSVNGAEVTSISGEEVYRAVYMTNGCSLIGFTLENGYTATSGGGAFLTDHCVIENCRLVGNEAVAQGGGAYLSADSELKNCLLVENSSGSNACVYLDSSLLRNCTISENIGRGVLGAGVVENCIVWSNSLVDINLTSGIVYDTCAASGVIPEVNGCISSDPLFVDVGNGNFQLSEISSCLDIGDNANAPAGKDLAGSARIINGTVDLGAYERFVVEADDDGDELPNWWELRHFESVMGSPPIDALCSNGVNTIEQAFLAGIDPRDPNAAFVTFMEHSPDSGGPIVRWNLVHGRVYTVHWTPDLLIPFTPLQSNVLWAAEGFVDRDHSEMTNGFYKIDVRLEE